MNFEFACSYLDTKKISYEIDKSTKELVSFRAGGDARIVAYPQTILEFCQLINFLYNNCMKFYILGNGTNVVFSDKEFDGIIVCTRCLSKAEANGFTLNFECGTPINSCCSLSLNNGLSGIESLYGIPGTIGGAVYINASAFGCSISETVYESLVYDFEQNIIYYLPLSDHRFEEKSSIFSKKRNIILLNTALKLSKSDAESIKNEMNRCLNYRKHTQPLSLPSAGSVFKRPKNNFASKLIDDAGLKGFTIGGAQVSVKHAGFIVNTGCSSYNDIKLLTQYIKKTIKQLYDVTLEEEVIFVE